MRFIAKIKRRFDSVSWLYLPYQNPMTKSKIEQKTAETILEKPRTIVVGNETFQVAPPTTATIIEVSELVSQLPAIPTDSNNIAQEALLIAKDCRILGDIVAVLVLGEANLEETRVTKKRRFFGLITETKTEIIDRKKELSKKLLRTLSPSKLNQLVIQILSGMEIADFFGLTTSLIEINITRQTRGVVKTIASGQ